MLLLEMLEGYEGHGQSLVLQIRCLEVQLCVDSANAPIFGGI